MDFNKENPVNAPDELENVFEENNDQHDIFLSSVFKENVKTEDLHNFILGEENRIEPAVLDSFNVMFADPTESEMEMYPDSDDENRLQKPKKRKPYRMQHARCKICFQSKFRPEIKKSTMRQEHLLVMTAALLNNETTVERANEFFSQRKSQNICRSHFPGIIDTFYRELGIGSLEEIRGCSEEAIDRVVAVMKMIVPSFRNNEFKRVLISFVCRNTGRRLPPSV